MKCVLKFKLTYLLGFSNALNFIGIQIDLLEYALTKILVLLIFLDLK